MNSGIIMWAVPCCFATGFKEGKINRGKCLKKVVHTESKSSVKVFSLRHSCTYCDPVILLVRLSTMSFQILIHLGHKEHNFTAIG